jgi:hypothetical protein
MIITCKLCGGQAKPAREFYRSCLATCKECYKARVTQRRLDNLEAIREYDRQRGKLPYRLYANKMAARRRRKENPEVVLAKTRRWREENPEKYVAHNAANNAQRDGLLSPQPCRVCGTLEGVEKHHPDYLQPLVVEWLCRMHHGNLHGALNAEERAR